MRRKRFHIAFSNPTEQRSDHFLSRRPTQRSEHPSLVTLTAKKMRVVKIQLTAPDSMRDISAK
jgi:hypothetical protein